MDIDSIPHPKSSPLPLRPSRTWLGMILAAPVLILLASGGPAVVAFPRSGWLIPVLSTEFVLLAGLGLASRFRASLSGR